MNTEILVFCRIGGKLRESWVFVGSREAREELEGSLWKASGELCFDKGITFWNTCKPGGQLFGFARPLWIIRKCHQYLVFLIFFFHNFFAFCLCSKSFRWHAEHLHLQDGFIFLYFPILASSRDLSAAPLPHPRSLHSKQPTHHSFYIQRQVPMTWELLAKGPDD